VFAARALASSVRVTGTIAARTQSSRMPAKTTAPYANEEMPESQRVTLPSPQPFPQLARRKRSPGEYRMIDGQEQPQSSR
jgi:hypothetical protein